MHRAIRLGGASGGKVAEVLREQLRMADEERGVLRQDLSAERRGLALLERRIVRAEEDNRGAHPRVFVSFSPRVAIVGWVKM